MKRTIRLIAMIMAICAFLSTSVSALMVTQGLFYKKTVDSYVYINQEKCYNNIVGVDVGAVYYLYCNDNDDVTSKTLKGTTTGNVSIAKAANSGKTHTLEVEYGSSSDGVEHSCTYTIH